MYLSLSVLQSEIREAPGDFPLKTNGSKILIPFLFERSLVTAEFAAATVLITYGAVLGKVSRLQLLVIGTLEVVFYAINELIAVEFLKYADAGGSVIIHTFGAYFGLALSRVLYTKKALDNPKEESNYHSDLFAMIGKSSLSFK